MSECTSSTFLILRKDLASISGRIVHHFQKLNEPAQYADVMKLQSELDGFVNSLPPAFKMRKPDKSQDGGEFMVNASGTIVRGMAVLMGSSAFLAACSSIHASHRGSSHHYHLACELSKSHQMYLS